MLTIEQAWAALHPSEKAILCGEGSFNLWAAEIYRLGQNQPLDTIMLFLAANGLSGSSPLITIALAVLQFGDADTQSAMIHLLCSQGVIGSGTKGNLLGLL